MKRKKKLAVAIYNLTEPEDRVEKFEDLPEDQHGDAIQLAEDVLEVWEVLNS